MVYLRQLLFIVFALGGTALKANAQQEAPAFTAKSAVYTEARGMTDGLLINYERILYQRKAIKGSIRVGARAYPGRWFAAYQNHQIAVPVAIIGLLGRNKHHLETGLGFTPAAAFDAVTYESLDGFDRVTVREDVYSYRVVASLGYRYQKPAGGLMIRAGVNPVLRENSPSNTFKRFFIFPGLAIGWSF